MQGYTYDTLIRNRAKRDEFFASYDRLIQMAKDAGHYKAALNHIDSRNEMKAHFEKFD
ncbi:hypothetical protein [Sinorhizobium fredii]|uniref:hypothetical protein n=1 Tax=Rhizobium fredii TaxID=380 RepID=UPI0004B2B780|nr:hypothetical protein [Sinorhizobium fredii]AWI60366.1 hypothetical protein AB395_00005189 [Sinorhizobium fredii CCBAU 45436]